MKLGENLSAEDIQVGAIQRYSSKYTRKNEITEQRPKDKSLPSRDTSQD